MDVGLIATYTLSDHHFSYTALTMGMSGDHCGQDATIQQDLVKGLGFRVSDLGLGFRVSVLGFRAKTRRSA